MNTEKFCLLIGNSRWHWAVKHAEDWQFIHTFPNPNQLQTQKISLLSWASVGPIPRGLKLDPSKEANLQDIPLIDIPPWIGIDRALGAWRAFKQANPLGKENTTGLLLADAGTILSLTKITKQGEFNGGQLIPGLRLQMEAMANGTESLDDPGVGTLDPEKFPSATAKAMRRGSVQALVGSLIEAQRETKLPIWLCGGDGPILYKELQGLNIDVIHKPNLVLEGMVDLLRQINPKQDH